MSNGQTISTEGIKANLRNPQGKDEFRLPYCAYIADRLPDTVSPQTFLEVVDKVVREIIAGESSDSTRPVPRGIVRDHAKKLGSFLLDDIVGLAKEHCPSGFAEGVYAAHKKHYG
ncbi:hypothetical protein HYX05_05245 [Candidatus Woesearchaeota archaeon]|nr:hypothetical protein [Candidatus Woesearchaeota archaeon]